MRRPRPGTRAFRRAHAENMADIRRAKAAAGECRQCDRTAATSSEGLFMKCCRKHLKQDRERIAARKKEARRVR